MYMYVCVFNNININNVQVKHRYDTSQRNTNNYIVVTNQLKHINTNY